MIIGAIITYLIIGFITITCLLRFMPEEDYKIVVRNGKDEKIFFLVYFFGWPIAWVLGIWGFIEGCIYSYISFVRKNKCDD